MRYALQYAVLFEKSTTRLYINIMFTSKALHIQQRKHEIKHLSAFAINIVMFVIQAIFSTRLILCWTPSSFFKAFTSCHCAEGITLSEIIKVSVLLCLKINQQRFVGEISRHVGQRCMLVSPLSGSF